MPWLRFCCKWLGCKGGLVLSAEKVWNTLCFGDFELYLVIACNFVIVRLVHTAFFECSIV